jgi:hypothetical protein
VQLENLLTQGNFFMGGAACFVFERDVELFGKELDRLNELEVFLLHDECEAVAAFACAKAFIKAAIRMNVKGRRFFLGKRAKPFPRATCTLELGIGRDDVDQVDLVLEGLDGALFNARQVWWKVV